MATAKEKNKLTFTIDALSVAREGRLIFEGLSTALQEGEILIFTGSNGSGKKTLLRTLAGFIPPYAGTVHFDDISIHDNPDIFRTQIALSGHQNGMKAALTLRKNLKIFSETSLGIRADDQNIEAAANALNLKELLDDEVFYFSAGQAHRAALAKLPLSGKKIWLMDEPTVGLDSTNRKNLTKIMQDHLKNKGLILVTTHEDLGIDGHQICLDSYAPTSHKKGGAHA